MHGWFWHEAAAAAGAAEPLASPKALHCTAAAAAAADLRLLRVDRHGPLLLRVARGAALQVDLPAAGADRHSDGRLSCRQQGQPAASLRPPPLAPWSNCTPHPGPTCRARACARASQTRAAAPTQSSSTRWARAWRACQAGWQSWLQRRPCPWRRALARRSGAASVPRCRWRGGRPGSASAGGRSGSVWFDLRPA